LKTCLTLLLAGVALCAREVGAQTPRADMLPLQHQVIGNQLPLNASPLLGINVDQSFTYVGGQRFPLFGVAEAEQHLFVVADSTKTVKRLYWVQIEGYLPDRPGSYDYSADSAVTIQGLAFRANVNANANSGPVRPGSDREWMLGLLSAHGYRMPRSSTRLRLTYLPDATRRREIMIVYLEPTAALGRGRDVSATLLSRASGQMHLIK
jgi:hypothetical protein